mgnify:CR=1 FL=1
MHIYGIITGDIVGSTKLSKEDRDNLIENLNQIIAEIASSEETDKAIEFGIYRGDSFQVKVTDAKSTLRVAMLIRLGLMCSQERLQISTLKKSSIWDARLSIGIGTIDYLRETINISDGEAFRYSGRAFELLKRTDRLIIRTSNKDLNDEFDTECFMADTILRRLSDNQARITYKYLLREETQKSIAEKLKVTPQAVNKSLQYGGNALRVFIKRFEVLIEKYYD